MHFNECLDVAFTDDFTFVKAIMAVDTVQADSINISMVALVSGKKNSTLCKSNAQVSRPPWAQANAKTKAGNTGIRLIQFAYCMCKGT